MLAIDLAITQIVQSSFFAPFHNFFIFVTYLGNPTPFSFLILFTFLILYFTKHKKLGIYVFLSTFIGATVSSFLKGQFARPRPSEDLISVLVKLNDNSFPSTHTLIFTIFFGFLYYYLGTTKRPNLWTKSLRGTCLLLIFSVGLSRIYLGAHWFTDCLAGYILGSLILFFSITLFKKNER